MTASPERFIKVCGFIRRTVFPPITASPQSALNFTLSTLAEYFCEKQGVDYMIVVMDVDNPASRRVAEKSGFKLFEKRTVYDYYYNRYCDDYFYFRRYWSGCTLKDRFYGDRGAYEGRQ